MVAPLNDKTMMQRVTIWCSKRQYHITNRSFMFGSFHRVCSLRPIAKCHAAILKEREQMRTHLLSKQRRVDSPSDNVDRTRHSHFRAWSGHFMTAIMNENGPHICLAHPGQFATYPSPLIARTPDMCCRYVDDFSIGCEVQCAKLAHL
jgi:hypothetical protein